jgi:glycosyltransferase involved in cell wall biosynthesis
MSHSLAFIILTKNEEANLQQCLASISTLQADVFVIDSGSTDNSVRIAISMGAVVLTHPFKNYADQMNWAIRNIQTSAEWIFRLDADEYVTPELCRELEAKLPAIGSEICGLHVRRRFHFLGKWIKHGGMYPLSHLRLWRRGTASCEERWMDEHMQLNTGLTHHLENDIVDRNNKDLTFWIDKHNWYSSRELQDMKGLTVHSGSYVALDGQAARKRWLKESLYARAPRFWRAFGFWIFRYFFLLGFLDGKEGLVFHFFQAFWYRFLVDAKLYEDERLAS